MLAGGQTDVLRRGQSVIERGDSLADIMRDPLKPFAECSDVTSLRCAIQELCADSGIAARVDILTLAQSEKRQALCFLRIESAAQERRLMGVPGLSRFGSDLLFVVDLPQYPQGKLRRQEGTDRLAAVSARPGVS